MTDDRPFPPFFRLSPENPQTMVNAINQTLQVVGTAQYSMVTRRKQQDDRPEEAATEEPPSLWGSFGVKALTIAVTILLVAIVVLVTLLFVLSTTSTDDDGAPEEQTRVNSSNTVARRSAILELELDGIAQEQELDERAFQTACTGFFSHTLLAQKENVENIECEIVDGRNLQEFLDYRIIRAAVYGDGPSSMDNFRSLLNEIVREGEEDFVARLVRSSQTFQSLTAVKVPENLVSAPGIRETIAQTIGNERLEQSGPYQEALDWISTMDPRQLNASSPNLFQRYVATYFYFATGPWTVCGPEETATENNCLVTGKVGTTEEIRWLSSDTECNWYGITCNARSQIVNITLGTYAHIFSFLVRAVI